MYISVWSWFIICFMLLGTWSTTQAQPLERYSFRRGLMGTQFTVTLYAPDSLTAQRVYAQVSARMDTLNTILSDYLDGSEINRLSQSSGSKQAVPVSAELFDILQKGCRIAHQSGGRFDPTIGPLSQLWRRAVRQRTFPPAKERRQARRAVGYRLIRLDTVRRTVRLLRPRMRLDVGGIGQGFAVDEAGRVLRAASISRFLLDLGGDVLAGDPPPERPQGWRVDMGSGTNARPDPADTLIIYLKNGAITTSGDTYRHLDLNGRRYSHIMNPRSGLGLTHFVRTTVLAPDGYRADALTKVFSLSRGLLSYWGPNKRLARRFPGIQVWVVEQKKGRLLRWQSTR
ncbi:FAD:protein FMN transferase [Rudanella paleaurantiibacter]|uniref:FAD:protein FMN transferase n=1 Tax=Rudanella paleaurantiibacter TaxID=2614655 RepID=A0A7J5U582_9BACT|nr:FAD:protein FMN transferase [Rudanella paleaurantiibacter]KAB7732925.1 FAD:protein FMN transferase [Rudanella paleaurantiibacter]